MTTISYLCLDHHSLHCYTWLIWKRVQQELWDNDFRSNTIIENASIVDYIYLEMGGCSKHEKAPICRHITFQIKSRWSFSAFLHSMPFPFEFTVISIIFSSILIEYSIYWKFGYFLILKIYFLALTARNVTQSIDNENLICSSYILESRIQNANNYFNLFEWRTLINQDLFSMRDGYNLI